MTTDNNATQPPPVDGLINFDGECSRLRECFPDSSCAALQVRYLSLQHQLERSVRQLLDLQPYVQQLPFFRSQIQTIDANLSELSQFRRNLISCAPSFSPLPSEEI